MFITLFLILFIIGLLLLLLPSRVLKCKQRKSEIILRASGLMFVAVSVVFIYAVYSGTIVLPLWR